MNATENRFSEHSGNRNTPEKKFRAGAITATVWKNGAERDGKAVSYFSVGIDRNYKDRNGKWQTTNSMRINDLPKAALVLTKAYEYLMLREQESMQYTDISEEAVV
ncbi:hypothetical protein JW968_07510 [Candidatus Woesearchaeota archaeon]|nr:hypothetical protein [Candidatus Woesearchaeota archaeon]